MRMRRNQIKRLFYVYSCFHRGEREREKKFGESKKIIENVVRESEANNYRYIFSCVSYENSSLHSRIFRPDEKFVIINVNLNKNR